MTIMAWDLSKHALYEKLEKLTNDMATTQALLNELIAWRNLPWYKRLFR